MRRLKWDQIKQLIKLTSVYIERLEKSLNMNILRLDSSFVFFRSDLPTTTLIPLLDTAACGITLSSMTAKVSPWTPTRSGEAKSGSKVLPMSCMVVTWKLLPSPATLTWCRMGAFRVEKQVPRNDKNGFCNVIVRTHENTNYFQSKYQLSCSICTCILKLCISASKAYTSEPR